MLVAFFKVTSVLGGDRFAVAVQDGQKRYPVLVGPVFRSEILIMALVYINQYEHIISAQFFMDGFIALEKLM